VAKNLHCWRCKTLIPMLDEREWALMSPALSRTIEDIQAYRRKTGASLSECPPQTSACHLYARLTGFVETNPNAIWHHRAADCGPFCRHCRRPLRTARASFCVGCGTTVDRESAVDEAPNLSWSVEHGVDARVFGASHHQVLAAVSQAIGPLIAQTHDAGDPHTYLCADAHVSVVTLEGAQIGVSVYRSGRWARSADFGRFLAQTLACRVYCDGGDEAPTVSDGYKLLEIEGGQERWAMQVPKSEAQA